MPIAGRSSSSSNVSLQKASSLVASSGVDDEKYITAFAMKSAIPSLLKAKTYTLHISNGSTRAITNVWDQIQAFADQVATLGGGNIQLVTDQPGVFWMHRQVKLNERTGLISGPGIRFRCTTNNAGYFDTGNYTDHYSRFPGGYMFTINAAYKPDGTINNDGYGTAWSVAYPGMRGPVFEGIVIEQIADDWAVPVHMLFAASPVPIRDCRTLWAHNLVMVPNVYMDGLHCERVSAAFPWVDNRVTDVTDRARQRGWITLTNSGDAVHINNCFANISMVNNRGSTITGGFGAVYLDGCDSVAIQGKHNETPEEWIEANNSTFSLTASQYWLSNQSKVRLKNNSHVTLRSVEWQWVMNYESVRFKAPMPEVAVDASSTVTVDDCARVQTSNGNIGLKYRSGILVAKWDVAAGTFTEIDDWTHYSHLLSKRGEVRSGHRVNLAHSIDSIPTLADSPNMSTEGAILQDANLGTTWNKTGQVGAVTYYYRATYAVDWPRRFYSSLAAGGAAPSTRTNGQTMSTRVVLYPSDDVNIYGATPSKGRYPRTLVLMRTSQAQVTATGGAITAATVWDDIAIIPMQDQAGDIQFYDQGDYISGYKWRAFGSTRPTQYQVKAASWANGKFVGVIPYNQARPANAAGVNSENGFAGDVLLADTPTGGYPIKLVRQASYAVANQQWLAVEQAPLVATQAITAQTITNGNQYSGTTTVTGAQVGDRVVCDYSTTLSNCILWGYVTAADTVRWIFMNSSGASQNLLAGTATIRVTRSQ